MGFAADVAEACSWILGCSCLDPYLWGPSSGSRAPTVPAPPVASLSRGGNRRAAADMSERLLAAEHSADNDGDAPRSAPPLSEDMFRAASFNTRLSALRSQTPFFRAQAQAPQQALAPERERAEGIELKPSGSNALLGVQHLENRGRFVAAHPVQHPGGASAIRRAASPSHQQQQQQQQQLAASGWPAAPREGL